LYNIGLWCYVINHVNTQQILHTSFVVYYSKMQYHNIFSYNTITPAIYTCWQGANHECMHEFISMAVVYWHCMEKTLIFIIWHPPLGWDKPSTAQSCSQSFSLPFYRDGPHWKGLQWEPIWDSWLCCLGSQDFPNHEVSVDTLVYHWLAHFWWTKPCENSIKIVLCIAYWRNWPMW
jgi:hypothetical protein